MTSYRRLIRVAGVKLRDKDIGRRLFVEIINQPRAFYIMTMKSSYYRTPKDFFVIERINACGSSPCVNGECIEDINGYRCNCSAGYQGIYCEGNTCVYPIIGSLAQIIFFAHHT